MEVFRIEKDSLGEVRVPKNAMYGAQTRRAMENFPITGKRPYQAFIWSVATIKRAAAEVNGGLGLLDAAKSAAIARAAEETAGGMWDAEFVVDPFQAGAGTSHNMNANEVIANRATQLLGGALGEYRISPNDEVNMAQSTNDVIPCAIRLGILWRQKELMAAVDGLSRSLAEKAAEWDGGPIFRMPFPSVLARNSEGMRKPSNATGKGCGQRGSHSSNSGSVERQPGPV
jgi:fumarate hydratase class II